MKSTGDTSLVELRITISYFGSSNDSATERHLLRELKKELRILMRKELTLLEPHAEVTIKMEWLRQDE